VTPAEVADFISFNEGRKEIANNGLPATCSFDLSSKDCNTHVVGDTFAGGYGVITGTGYAAQTEAEPTASRRTRPRSRSRRRRGRPAPRPTGPRR
jgi:hypothetical protein